MFWNSKNDGSTLEEVAEEFGISRDDVLKLLHKIGHKKPPKVLPDWMVADVAMTLARGPLDVRLGRGGPFLSRWKSLRLRLGVPQPQPAAPTADLKPGEIRLKAIVQNRFHKKLITPNWLQAASAFLGTHEAVRGRGADGFLFSHHNEDRYMGPESVVKYRFSVNLLLNEPESPLESRPWFMLEFRPKESRFVVKRYLQHYAWRENVLRSLLLQNGLISEAALLTFQSQPRVRRLLGRGSLARWLVHSGLVTLEALGGLLDVPEANDAQVAAAGLLYDEEWTQACEALSLHEGQVIVGSPLALESFDWLQSMSMGAQPLLASGASVRRRISELTRG